MRKSSTIKGEEYKKLIERLHGIEQPKNDKVYKNMQRFIEPTACSAEVAIGGNDARPMSEEAKEWLRDVKSPKSMDDSFWTKKAPQKLFEEKFDDSLFEADKEVNTVRQLRK